MSVEQAVYDRIKSLAGSRVWAGLLPQGAARPALTYQVISGNAVRSLGGHSGLVQYRVQIDAWGDSYLEMTTVLATAIVTMRPNAADFTVSAEFRGPDLYEDDVSVHHGVVDFVIWYHG